jgi:hypothetical protein
MRLPIDTSGMTFMCAAPGKPVTDFETGQHKADGNGELLFNLQVCALNEDGGQILVLKVPGDPKVQQGAMLRLEGWWRCRGRWVTARVLRSAPTACRTSVRGRAAGR